MSDDGARAFIVVESSADATNPLRVVDRFEFELRVADGWLLSMHWPRYVVEKGVTEKRSAEHVTVEYLHVP